jgi:hypothetical protein
MCGQWGCDDCEYDWEWIGPDEPGYSAVKREWQIVYYHEPRTEWQSRLQAERDARSGGAVLWVDRDRA